MSSGCGDVLSLEDLKTAKKHQVFEAEVITGRAGGVASGDSIDYATNQATGQVQKTMPAILRDIGFRPASFDFVSGGTIGMNDRDLAVLWPLPSGDGDWYYWEGALPKSIPANSSPATTGGVADGAWRPVGDITLRGQLASNDANKGAALIGNFHGGTVQQALQYVTPSMFGIAPQLRAATGMTDYGVQLQAMIDYAVANNLYVDTQVPGTVGGLDSNVGFYTTKPINLTGLAGLRGVLPIYVDGNTFVDTLGFKYAVVVADADYTSGGNTIIGNTTKGNLNFDWIEVRNLSSRVGAVRGILWTATRSTVKKLKALHFGGTGIWLAQAYDSTFERVEVEFCGNRDEWAFDAFSYTPQTGFVDETNGLCINGMLIHNCTDRAWRVFGSKCFVNAVHEEATYSVNLPTTATLQDTRTSLGYMSSFFSSVGGALGQVSVLPDSTISTMNHVFAFAPAGTSASTIYTSGTAVIMPGDPSPRGGFVGNIFSKDLYIISNSRTTIGRVESTGTFYGRDPLGNSPILGGFLTAISENVGNIYNTTFRNATTINPGVVHTYEGCTFNSSFLSVSIQRVNLVNCVYNASLTTIASTKMYFLNCRFNVNLSIDGTDLDVEFDGGQIVGNLVILSPGGVWLFPKPPRINGVVTNWSFPTAIATRGCITRNPSPSITVGTIVEQTSNGVNWVITQKVPA
ncbi:MAG: hypothetical protein ACRDE7_00310 [Sphingobacterium sp.]